MAHARQREVADVLNHPQLTARDRWQSVDTPAGTVRAVLPAITVVGQTLRMDPVPDVGQHSRQILASSGYTADAIDALSRDGVY